MLDTFHDQRHAYLFFVNPMGIQADGQATEGQFDDNRFDALWQSEARVTESGYIALLRIPFRSLRFSADPNAPWGIALLRFIPSTPEAAFWPKISAKSDTFIPQFGEIEWPTHPQPSHNISLTPYLFSGLNQTAQSSLSAVPTFPVTKEFRGGLDAKASFSNGLTLDTTFRPDFSTIESDAPQVTVNQRYELYYPELRPFFQDNSSYFEMPDSLFFSRRVRSPEWGAKLTGKLGRWSIGALAAQDRKPAGVDSQARASLAVLRIQRDFGTRSTAGFFVSTTHSPVASNEVAAVDARIRPDGHWTLTSFLAKSVSEDSTVTPLSRSGNAAFFEVRRASRHFTWFANYRDRSPDFDAALGFITRTGIRQYRGYAGYRFFPESGPLTSWGPAFLAQAVYDNRNQLQDAYWDLPISFEFKGPFSFGVDHTQIFERWLGAGFHKHFDTASVSVDRWKKFVFSANFTKGRALNYYPGPGIAPHTGASQNAGADFTWRPNSRLRWDGSYLFARLRKPGAVLYNDHQFRAKINYQFSARLSARAIFDYSGILANPDQIELDTQKRLRTNFLLVWKLNPFTAIHAGYADARENLSPMDLESRTKRPDLLLGRSVYVKVNYWWRP